MTSGEHRLLKSMTSSFQGNFVTADLPELVLNITEGFGF